MRRLECMRLQPPPDAASCIAADHSQCRSRYKPCLLSGQQYSVAVNGVLFEGVQSNFVGDNADVVQENGSAQQQRSQRQVQRHAARWK